MTRRFARSAAPAVFRGMTLALELQLDGRVDAVLAFAVERVVVC